MKHKRLYRLVILSSLLLALLYVLRFNELKVALSRAERQFNYEGLFTTPGLVQCARFETQSPSQEAQHFASLFSQRNIQNTGVTCYVSVVSQSLENTFWQAHWSFHVVVSTENSQSIVGKSASAHFPKPVTLLPLLIFFLAALLELPVPSVAWLGCIYLCFLSGINLVAAVNLAFSSFIQVPQKEPSFIGWLLVALWSVVYSRSKRNSQEPVGQWHKSSRYFSSMVGVWNPAIYTIISRFVLNRRSRLEQIASFCETQVVWIVLSATLFSATLVGLNEKLPHALLLPRYFSLLLVISFIVTVFYRQKTNWKDSIPKLFPWQAALTILCFETLWYLLQWTPPLPPITRIGLLLILTEIPRILSLPVRAWLKPTLAISTPLLFSFTLGIASESSGIFDTVFSLLDPALHPNNQGLVTFVLATAIGFLGGSFSIAYFAIHESLIFIKDSNLLKAAVIDGALVGCLLSPFSIWNWIPSLLAEKKQSEFLVIRLKTVLFPLLSALIVFGVDIIKAVQLLRPITFIFILLIGLALVLKKNRWEISPPQSH